MPFYLTVALSSGLSKSGLPNIFPDEEAQEVKNFSALFLECKLIVWLWSRYWLVLWFVHHYECLYFSMSKVLKFSVVRQIPIVHYGVFMFALVCKQEMMSVKCDYCPSSQKGQIYQYTWQYKVVPNAQRVPHCFALGTQCGKAML